MGCVPSKTEAVNPINCIGLRRSLSSMVANKRLSFILKNKNLILNITDLMALLEDLKERSDKQSLIQASVGLIENGYNLAALISFFPENRRLAFATKYQSKIQDASQLITVVLHFVPTKDRMALVVAHQAKIRNGDELARVLYYVPPEARLSFVTAHQAKIENAGPLVDGDYEIEGLGPMPLVKVLAYLTPEECLAFVTAHQAKITNGDQLIKVLPHLAPTARLNVARAHQEKIGDARLLALVLKCFPKKDCLAFATENLAKIEKLEALIVLLRSYLPVESRLAFATAFQARVENVDQLLQVLNCLPKKDQVGFASAHEAKIQGGSALASFLESIPNSLRVALTMRFLDKIQNAEEFFLVMEAAADPGPVDYHDAEVLAAAEAQRVAVNELKLSDHYLAKINECFSRLETAAELVDLLKCLPEPSIAAFVNKLENKPKIQSIIQNAQSLIVVLKSIPQGSVLLSEEQDPRLSIATLCVAKITSFDELDGVMKLLPIAHRVSFVKKVECRAKITTVERLRTVSAQLPDNLDVVAFFGEFQDLIKDGMDLVELIRNRSIVDQLNIVSSFLNTIKDSEQLFSVMEGLVRQLYSGEEVHADFKLAIKTFIESPVYRAKLEELFLSAENISNLTQIAVCMTKDSRVNFITREAYLAKITNVDDIQTVLRFLPLENRLTIADRPDCRARITNTKELCRVLCDLPYDPRVAFAESFEDLISNGNELIEVLSSFSTYYSYLLENATPPTIDQVLPFAEGFRDKISTEKMLLDIFSLRGFSELNSTQRYSFVQACPLSLSPGALLSLKIYLRSVFNDPKVQQKFSLGELDPAVFLFSAAADPLREADFDYFLEQPLCSPNSLNESAKTLILYIEEQESLSGELKASRIAKVMAQQKLRRNQTATEHLAFNLSSLKQTELKFIEELPTVEPQVWPQASLDAARIQRFRQLIQWLKTQSALAEYQADFAALEGNTLIRTSCSEFNSIADELESFVATLALYLKLRKPALNETDRRAQARALASHLDASGQLGFCMEGVRSSLQSMTRSLNPGAGLVNAVDVAVDQAIRVFIELAGIRENMEVHASKDWLLLQLGIDSRIHHDSYRLPISPAYLKAIAKNAAGRLTPDFLIEQSVPSLESLQEAPVMIFNAATINLLERDWYALHTAGLLPENRSTSLDRCVDVMCFIDSTLGTAEAYAMIGKYQDENNQKQPLLVNLSAEVLKARYRRVLETSGVLSIKAVDITAIEAAIWSILTSDESDLSHYDEFLQRILNAPNALAWVKAVIESHTAEERANIKLKVLLHCPKDSKESLFGALACDPYSAGWMMAWELKRADAVLSFNPSDTGFLGGAVGELAADTALMHTEMEEIFVRSGNLLFWLGELQKDAPRRSTFDCIMAFISAQGMYRYDSFLGVLHAMSEKGDDLEKTTAQTFLVARCDEQRTQNLWSCYWKTACYLKDFELNFDTKEMLLSLQDPFNARAAVYLSKSNQELILKITQACGTGLISREEYVVIITTINSLYPAVAPLTTPVHADERERPSFLR